MKSFKFYSPTRIFFGDDQEKDFAEQLCSLGKKGVIITGGGSVERLGYLERVLAATKSAGIVLTHFSGIEANPISSTVNKIAKEIGAGEVDFVIALGGGSVMDASKAISFMLKAGEDDIWPFVAGEKRAGEINQALPIVCIPTTAATASEVTPFAVISNPERHGKAPIAHDCLKPTLSWINPAFTVELPDVTTRDGAADILSHVFENYILGGDSAPVTDRYCEGIIRTVVETLPELGHHPGNLALRGSMLWCSTLALNGMQTAGRNQAPFVLHAMEHALSGFQHDLAHGRGLATLYPSYFKWLLSKDRACERFAQLNHRVFDKESSADGFVSNFSTWLKENQLYQSLYDLGFEKKDFSSIAAEVMRVNAGEERVLDVLGPMTEQDIVEIFEGTATQQ